MRAPERTIRRALVAGTTLVVVALPRGEPRVPRGATRRSADPDGDGPLARGIAYADRDRVGSAAMEALVGPTGALVMALAIMVSTFGCVNGLVLSRRARLVRDGARRALLRRRRHPVDRRHADRRRSCCRESGPPILTLSGTYGDLLDYVIFAALLFYALTVAATLRFGERIARDPARDRRSPTSSSPRL